MKWYKSILVKDLIIIVTVIMLLITTGYAKPVDAFRAGQRLVTLALLVRRLCLGLAVISVSTAALLYLVGDVSLGGKMKTAIIIMLVAVAAMYLLPLFINKGIQIGQNYAWDPNSIQ